jgi:predicted cupin superfamily sugar epimerase
MSQFLPWIEKLKLQPHPEGGFFAETWRASLTLAQAALSSDFGGDRAAGTAIYYLLTPGTFSRLHRLRADEVWHHYDGGDLRISILHPDGGGEELLLGKGDGALPQCVVPAGVWFGSRPVELGGWVLAGCTMAPGFDFADFELAARSELLRQYPQHRETILDLTVED